MHVSALVASATIAAAAVIRNDPYVGNFRSFGAAGCHDQNLGVWTVTQSGVTGACNDFRGNTVVSLENTRIVDGYTCMFVAGVGMQQLTVTSVPLYG
jgi:hypothetical protein